MKTTAQKQTPALTPAGQAALVPYKVARLFRNNQPDAFAVTCGKWSATCGKITAAPMVALCEKEEDAEFIKTACNSHAALVAALEATETLAQELMQRASRIDLKLAAAGGSPVPECELGEIARLRGQLSKNRAALASTRATT